MFEAIKFLGVIRFVATYPILGFVFRLLQSVIPSVAAKRVAHLAFTEKKILKRLEREVDRKDFMTYVSLSLINNILFLC